MVEQEHNEELEIDLREYLLFLWRKKWIIAGVVILAMLAAFIYSQVMLDVNYQLSSELLVTQPRYTEIDVARISFSTYRDLALSDRVLNKIIEKLELRNDEDELLAPRDIRNKMDIDVEDPEDQEENIAYLFTLNVTGADSEAAAEIANAWSEFFMDDILDIRQAETDEIFRVTSSRFEETRDRLSESEDRLQQLRVSNRPEQLAFRKDEYLSHLQELESDMLELEHELERKKAVRENLAETIDDMQAEGTWEGKFYQALEVTDELSEAGQDLLAAQKRLREKESEFRTDILSLEKEMAERELKEYREQLSRLEQREKEGYKEDILDLEEEIAEKETGLSIVKDELAEMETEEGLWLGDITLDKLKDMRPDMKEAVENYLSAREKLLDFREKHDLAARKQRLEFITGVLETRRTVLAEMEDEYSRVSSDFAELEVVLQEEPDRWTLERSLSDDAFWGNLFSAEELEILAAMVLEDEEINPVYQRLREERAFRRIQLSSLPRQIEYFEGVVTELEAEEVELRYELTELREREADLVNSLDVYERLYTDWREDFRDLKREETEITREIQALESRMAMMEEFESDHLAEQQNYYHRLVQNQEDRVQELDDRLRQYNDDLKLLEQDAAHYQEIYDHQAAEYRELENRYFTLDLDIKEIKAEIDYLSSSKAEIQASVNELEDEFWEHEKEETRLTREIDGYENTHQSLSGRMEDARLAQAEQTSDVRFIAEAIPPGDIIGRGTSLNMAIAAVLAAMLGVFGVSFQKFMKDE